MHTGHTAPPTSREMVAFTAATGTHIRLNFIVAAFAVSVSCCGATPPAQP